MPWMLRSSENRDIQCPCLESMSSHELMSLSWRRAESFFCKPHRLYLEPGLVISLWSWRCDGDRLCKTSGENPQRSAGGAGLGSGARPTAAEATPWGEAYYC